MADRQTQLTHAREERHPTRRSSSWGDPFGVMQRFADEMDRMFDDFGVGRRWGLNPWRGAASGPWSPQVEVFQKGDQLTVRVDLPGMKREDISIEVSDNAITLQGERRGEHHEEGEGYYRSERSYGSFSRTIPLPDGAIADQAKASFADGVLEITMPAPPASKGRRIEISDGKK